VHLTAIFIEGIMMKENEVMTIESGTIALLNKSKIEQQVATTHTA
jgi:hypothetical protein